MGKTLVCPKCGVSLEEGSFTTTVTYSVHVGGTDYPVHTRIDQFLYQGQYMCSDCGEEFDEFSETQTGSLS